MYANKRMTSKEVGEYFNVTSKTIRNWLTRYGIPIRQNGEAVKLERSKWSDDKERARSKKFIQTWSDTPLETKQEITKKRTKNINSPEAIEKAKQTKLLHGTNKESKAEDDFFKKLSLFFKPDDLIRPYKDDNRYPYLCDFYIKSKDFFIEYQGHYTHGTKPYIGDSQDKSYLDKLLTAGVNMDTMTKRDPQKLQCALNHKINLLLIYPGHDAWLASNGKLKTSVKYPWQRLRTSANTKKTDYGFSLDKQIAEQACGELAYEIDTEIVDMLYTEAEKDTESVARLTWSKTLPVGVDNHCHFA